MYPSNFEIRIRPVDNGYLLWTATQPAREEYYGDLFSLITAVKLCYQRREDYIKALPHFTTIGDDDDS